MANHTISGGQVSDWSLIGDNDTIRVMDGGSVRSRSDAITSLGVNNYVDVAAGGSVISSEGIAVVLNDHS